MMNAIISDLRQVYTSNPEYTYVPTFYVTMQFNSQTHE